ncbi:MAG: tyrosine-type recombinase/integrase [Thermoguttaceae bacterium]|jgi:integrase
MARQHFTTKTKPAKPNPNFPLFPHRNGQWAKAIRGQGNVYFGVWADPQAALDLYYREQSAWDAGRNPRKEAAAAAAEKHRITVGQMVALTLDAKDSLVKTGELKPQTYREYAKIGQRLKDVWGAGTAIASLDLKDFAKLKAHFAAGHPIQTRSPLHRKRMSKGHKSLVSLKGDVRKVRVFFNYMKEAGYIVRSPAYGVFKVPSKKSLRLERKGKPKRRFLPEQIAALLSNAGSVMQAMIWLGINCAFGDTDCAVLREQELDLAGGWATFIREKTGVKRRCPLWPETVDALRAALVMRPVPPCPALAGRVFITARGNAWSDLSVCDEFKKVRTKAGLDGAPGFYALRHTFITQARKEIADMDAIRMITGHVTDENDMLSSVYDEDWNDVDDERIRPVADCIRNWLRSSDAWFLGMDEPADVLSFGAQCSAS